MQTESTLLRGLSPSVADAPEAEDEWAKSPVSGLSDAALVGAVAAAIERPKREADSSFLTHAPLELAARVALLPMVSLVARDQARRRIAAIVSRYASEGEEIENAERGYSSTVAALGSLISAMREGDAGEVDAAFLFLTPRVPVFELRRALAGEIIPMLGAAAHVPIFLAELPRLETRLPNAAALLRAPLRMLTKAAQFRLAWHERTVAADPVDDGGEAMFKSLLAPPRVQSPSLYIAPTMLAIEADGYAERMLADVTANLSPEAASRAILRIGALSMLQDDPEHAPYGWSHALTMPQGVLSCADGVGDKTMLVRIAATYALGFRATLGRARLRDEPPPRPKSDDLFNVAPIDAAGAVYHAPDARIGGIRTALATRAATHGDAHLVKYTLACFDAAGRAPEASRLFLAAAAYLGAWWDAHPGASFE